MNILLLELKKYLYNGRLILFCLASTVLLAAFVFTAAGTLVARQSLFEPFSIGIVDNDNTTETNFLIDTLNRQEKINAAVTFIKLTEQEAHSGLEQGLLPAYLEIPAQFTEDIKNGRNSPFTLYGNSKRPMQLAVTKVLSKAGIAFLTSSQAGIYASIDYAYEHGLSYEIINEQLVMPLNLQFAIKLYNYGNFFTMKNIPFPEGLSPSLYYLLSLSSYWLLLVSIVFIKILKDSIRPGLTARYKLAGFSFWTLHGLRFFGIFAACLFCVLPLAFFIGYRILFIALSAAAFALMAACFWKSGTACGLFVFIGASLMLLFSGGIVPAAYLPASFQAFKYFTVIYWIIRLPVDLTSMLALTCMSVCFFIVGGVFLCNFSSEQ